MECKSLSPYITFTGHNLRIPLQLPSFFPKKSYKLLIFGNFKVINLWLLGISYIVCWIYYNFQMIGAFKMVEKNNQAEIEFGLQKIYVKDISFESPQAPLVFQTEWKPKVNLEFSTKTNKLDEEYFEVSLEVTINAQNNDKPAFVVEIEQAGIFFVKGASGDMLEQMLHIHCPTILFPYIRECVDNLLIKGSFPPIMLAPINFESVYQERKQKNS